MKTYQPSGSTLLLAALPTLEEKFDKILEAHPEHLPTVSLVDQGIGSYEFWGATGVDTRMELEITDDGEPFRLFITRRTTFIESQIKACSLLRYWESIDPPTYHANTTLEDPISCKLLIQPVVESIITLSGTDHKLFLEGEWELFD